LLHAAGFTYQTEVASSTPGDGLWCCVMVYARCPMMTSPVDNGAESTISEREEMRHYIYPKMASSVLRSCFKRRRALSSAAVCAMERGSMGLATRSRVRTYGGPLQCASSAEEQRAALGKHWGGRMASATCSLVLESDKSGIAFSLFWRAI
jgi:hypothetical protein